MQQFIDLGRDILDNGIRKPNRTGIDTIGIQGAMMKFDLADGFPIVTVKKSYWKSAVAEMLSFLRGYSNIEDFQKLGCKVWDANANSEAWLANHRNMGDGDLGRIYGVQARDWRHVEAIDYDIHSVGYIDQLKKVVDDLSQGIDDRREIVTHWNPGELDEMALPPCHLLYQFGIQGDKLNLSMYQRSADYALGVPFNIIGYSWLLMVIAQITGLKAGVFTHFIHDAHIYVNHLDGVNTMLNRKPLPLPQLLIDTEIKTLKDLETWVNMDAFSMAGYQHSGPLHFEMAV